MMEAVKRLELWETGGMRAEVDEPILYPDLLSYPTIPEKIQKRLSLDAADKALF